MSENGANGHQSVGLIFDDVDTAQGASITSAYIQFTADENDSDDVTLRVRGVDTDNAPAWSGAYAVDNAVDTDDSDGYIGTAASTVWTPAAWSSGEKGDDTQVDVTDIVQEIVDRGGWVAVNDMAFAVQYISGDGKRVAERENDEPELIINWSETVTTTYSGQYEDADGDGDADDPTLIRVRAVIEYDAYGRRREVEYQTFIREFGIGD
jgi:hypothetical protein